MTPATPETNLKSNHPVLLRKPHPQEPLKHKTPRSSTVGNRPVVHLTVCDGRFKPNSDLKTHGCLCYAEKRRGAMAHYRAVTLGGV